MTDERNPRNITDSAPDAPQVVVVKERSWGTKILLVLMTLALIAVAGLLAALWLPRWWAHRVGGVVDGTISTGIFAGLTCGVVFTLIPLLLLRRVFSLHAGISSRVIALVAAVLVAAPNLTTLAIETGSSNAVHAAQRTLDVDAPGFRGATAAGAVIGAVLALLWWLLLAGRHRRKRQVEKLKAEVHDRDEALWQRELEQKRAAKAEAERAEAERAQAERAQAERVQAERVQAERIQAERAQAERVDPDRDGEPGR